MKFRKIIRFKKRFNKNEKKYRSLFYNHAAAKIIIDPENGDIIDVNEAAAKFYGWNSEQLKKMNISQINLHASNEIKKGFVRNHHNEYKHLHSNGSIVDVEVFSSRINLNGKDYIHSIIHDISGKKQAESALRESEERYRLIMDNSIDAILLSVPDGNIISANKSACRMFGMTEDEILYADIKDIIAEDDKNWPDLFQKSNLNGGGKGEIILKRKNGENFPAEISISPFQTSKGEVRNSLIIRETTERVNFEKALLENEEIFRNFLENSPIYIFFKDKDIRPVKLSRNYEKMLQRPLDEVLGKTMDELFPSELAKSMIADDKKVLNEGRLVVVDEELNGRHFTTIKFPIIINDQPLYLAGYTLDVTESKKTEESLRANLSLLKIAGESARFGGWSVDLADKKVIWSEVVAFIHDEPADFYPTLDQTFNYYAPEYRKTITDSFTKCAEQGIPFDEELQIITAKDKRTWVKCIGKAEKNKNGDIIKIHGSFQDIDKIKIAESKLEESRQALSRLIGNLYGIAYRCSFSMNRPVEYISQGCRKMTGYSDNDFYNKKISWEMLIFEEDRASVWNEILNKTKTKEPFQVEYRIKHRNGQKRWVWEKGCGVCDNTGKINALESFITDITERKNAEEALIESEKNYRELIDGMNETVWVLDTNGNLIDVNKTAVRVLGYTKKELLSMGIIGIDLSLRKENTIELIKSMPEKKIQIFQTTHRTKDGKVFPVEVYSSVVTYKGEKAILNIARNITQRKRDEEFQQILYEIARTSMGTKAMEELLVVVRRELVKVLDTTNFYVALYNEKTEMLRKVIFVNEKFDIEEWEVKDSLSGEVIKYRKTLLLQGEERVNYAAKHGLNLIGVPPECWLGVPLMVDNKPIGVIVVQSYSDAKAYDKDSARLMEIIAHELAIVFQREKMIQDLIHAKEKAEESDRLKTAFLANISHEIRTPMNGILGFLELLAQPNLEEGQKDKYLEIVNKSGQRLLNTINNIVEVSKIESAQLEVSYDSTDISEVMGYHYDFFTQQAQQKGLTLLMNQKVSGKEAQINTDKAKLEGILTNLINNAIKFTIKGEVEFGNYLEDNRIVFYVKDSGIGIPPDKTGDIFKRFIQIDQSLTRAYEGSGLGLSIVKAYIESLGGIIWVDSSVGKGSVFYFSIPYKHLDTKTTETITQKTETRKFNSKAKILIAEDDEISYRYLETILSKHYKLLHSTTGGETVRIFSENPDVALILMDIKMPEMDGLQATREIRKINPNVPVIAQTAYAFSNDENKAKEAGCNDYISKPVIYHELIEKIKKCLENQI